MDDLSTATDPISRIEDLERRVFALEHPVAVENTAVAPASFTLNFPPVTQPALQNSPAAPGAIFSVLGKAVLGPAGAYLLRALEESGALPHRTIVALAIAYAVMWLVFAGRARSSFAALAYSTTSCLLLAPMLLEMTLRFEILSAIVAATVLAAFAMAALLLAPESTRLQVLWPVWITATVTALLLMVATHRLLPFVCALLFVALLGELSMSGGPRFSGRVVAGMILDLALALLLFVYTGPESNHREYNALSPQVLMVVVSLSFLLYAISITILSAVHQQTMTVFDILQSGTTCVLALGAWLLFHRGDSNFFAGVGCLVLGAGSYFIHFARCRNPLLQRNRQVFALWGVVLLVLGSYFSLPQPLLAIWLGIAAVLATLVGVRHANPTLEFHGMFYLLAAALLSGLLTFIGQTLTAPHTTASAWSYPFIFACAAMTYAFGQSTLHRPWRQRLPSLVSATLSVAALAALLVALTARYLLPSSASGPGLLQLTQTLATCMVALALVYSSAHSHHVELLWIAYATVIFVAAKLLFHDLRQGHFAFIAGSFCLYAATLMALPRLAAAGQPKSALVER